MWAAFVPILMIGVYPRDAQCRSLSEILDTQEGLPAKQRRQRVHSCRVLAQHNEHVKAYSARYAKIKSDTSNSTVCIRPVQLYVW